MHETRGSYWNYIETIIIIRFMLYRSAQIFQEPISMYPIFRNRKPGRDRVAPLTMNESLSIRVGREPNVNRRKRKKVFWMKIGEGSQIGERERKRERKKKGGQCCGLFDVLFQPKGVKTCASFFPDPTVDPTIASSNAFALIRP